MFRLSSASRQAGILCRRTVPCSQSCDWHPKRNLATEMSLPRRRLRPSGIVSAKYGMARSPMHHLLERTLTTEAATDNMQAGIAECAQVESRRHMITSPIFYVNAEPHIGHLYTALICDAMARWQRVQGHDAFFCIGTDEHGQKVQEAADAKQMPPLEFCNLISGKFKEVFDQAEISYDDFIRTTEERHAKTACLMWQKLEESNHIYLGKHTGWYCKSDETFLTEQQVVDVQGEDGRTRKPVIIIFAHPSTNWIPMRILCIVANNTGGKVSAESGHPVEIVSEDNYLFRLSAMQQPLLQWLKDNPDCIIPASRHKEVLAMVSQGLHDISISRRSDKVNWAISVPGNEEHTIYVWLDALTNYLTVAGYPWGEQEKQWPPRYQVVGKDIVKFHAIYWPAFLLAAGLELPQKIIAHAHWTVGKVKMSKSLGNVVRPSTLFEKFGIDPVRFFLLKEGGLTDDGDFSEELLEDCRRQALANTLGNLVTRTCGRSLMPSRAVSKPSTHGPAFEKLFSLLENLPSAVKKHYDRGEFSKGINLSFEALSEANRVFTMKEPWKLRKLLKQLPQEKAATMDAEAEELDAVLYMSLETVRITATLLIPIMPRSMDRLLTYLGVSEDSRTYSRLQVGYFEEYTLNELEKDQSFRLFPKS